MTKLGGRFFLYGLLLLSGAVCYSIAAHFLSLYVLELPLRYLELGISILVSTLVFFLFHKPWSLFQKNITANQKISWAALALTLLTILMVFIKGYNQLPPYPPDHILSFHWDNQADKSPLIISAMNYSYGDNVPQRHFQVGGSHSFQNNAILLQGPDNKIIFENNEDVGVKVQLAQMGSKKIEATWDGLPLAVRSDNGVGILKLAAYQWDSSAQLQKVFWSIGLAADLLAEFGLLFILYFYLLLVLSVKGLVPKQGNKMVWTLLAVYLLLILQRAWLNDDSFITFRTVDNFINGYGLTWNVGERVQAYTHPLWLFLISLVYFFIRNIYITSLLVSLGLSFGAVFLVSKHLAQSAVGAVLAILILSLSNAFVDYSTSGLENPLSYFLLAIFLVIYFKDGIKNKIFWLSLTASLGLVNRLDAGVFYIFPLLYAFCRDRSWKNVGLAFLGQLPFFGWEAFSLVYYGFPFPNTAYAKLSAGISREYYFQWAWSYFRFTFERDSLTFVGILAGLAAALYKKEWRLWAVAAGIPLYLGYIINIGGDFMGGRYFALPLFCAMILLCRVNIKPLPLAWAAAGLALVGGIAFQVTYVTPVAENIFKSRPDFFDSGISDERLYYARGTGLINLKDNLIEMADMGELGNFKWPNFAWRDTGDQIRQLSANQAQSVFITEVIGLKGYYGGPQVHIIDVYSLSEPLLARLPAINTFGGRVGHLERPIPDGYIESIESGANRIKDPKLAAYYDKLSLVVKGNIFSLERLQAIIDMNLGKYDTLIDTNFYKNMPAPEVSAPQRYWIDQ